MKDIKQIPGKLGFPLIGEALEQFNLNQLFFLKRFNQYGTIFKTKLFYMNCICLVGAKANQFVLQNKGEHFSNNLGWSFLKPFFGEGLFTQDGLSHTRAKRLMIPAFHTKAVESNFSIVKRLAQEHISDYLISNEPILVLKFFRKLTLSGILYLIFGESVKKDIDCLSRWFLDLNEGIQTTLRIDIPITKYGRALTARRKIESYILNKIQEYNQDDFEPNNILSLLLKIQDETGDYLKETEIIPQILQLMFGGFQTTAELLTWSLFVLGKYPEWRDILKKEQEQQVVGELDILNLKKLNQLSFFIKEVERLYPPVYVYPRFVIKDFEFEGYLIPQGWYTLISPLLTHRQPELFKNPDIFDPFRFAPPREEHKQNPFALIGFGAGIHKCLGYELAILEVKIILSLLLKMNWKITSDLTNFSLLPNNKNLKKLRFMITD